MWLPSPNGLQAGIPIGQPNSTVLIAVLEKWWKPIPKKLFFGLAGGLLIIAVFQAWRDEQARAEDVNNNNKVIAEAERQRKTEGDGI